MLRWFAERRPAPNPGPTAPAAATPDLATLSFPKFNDAFPTPQAALDLFKDRWASSLPDLDGDLLIAGGAAHFTEAPQARQAAEIFGGGTGRLDGFRVLELGPMEGGHTYQLGNLGADVTAVEGNAEAYLKCLITKEILGTRGRFQLGDFVRYLEQTDQGYDMVLASGVLYHMVQPLKLIQLICKVAPRCLMWTHYYDAELCEGYQGEMADYGGVSAMHFSKGYGDRTHGKFWGGLADSAAWLPREDILRAFEAFGHANVQVVDEGRDHPHGPCITIATSR